MERFVKDIHPELYDDWKIDEDNTMHPEDPPYIRKCLNDATRKLITGETTVKELDALKTNLRMKREIPRWYEVQFNVEYDHNEKSVAELIELRTTDEEAKHPLKLRSIADKRKLSEIMDDKRREVRVKFKKMELDKYIWKKRERAAKKERKCAANQDGKNTKQAKALGFEAPNAEELRRRRESLTRKTERKHRTKSCHKCSRCKADNCRECVNCKDMKEYCGNGTKRQKCVHRRCLNPQL